MKKKTKVAGIDFSRKYICMECGCQRDPIYVYRGMLSIELIMWGIFVVPGVAYAKGIFWIVFVIPGATYSIWRRLRKQRVCPKCLNPAVELTHSSRVMSMMQIMKSFGPAPDPLHQASKSGASPKSVTPNKAPVAKAKPAKRDVNKILKTANRRGLKPKGQQGLVDFKSPSEDK